MKRHVTSPEEAAYLDLLRTAEALSRPFAALFKTEDLSAAQYNVLRILRGSGEGLTCREIAERTITRDPDITRLLDRLVKRKLIERRRGDRDRRLVLARIAPQGIEILARLDEPVHALHRKLLGHLGAEGFHLLGQLLAACRSRLPVNLDIK